MPISLADVKEIVARAGGIAIERIPDDPHAPLDRLGLDSIAYVSIVLEIDRRYGVALGDDDFPGIRTLGEAVERLNRRLAGR